MTDKEELVDIYDKNNRPTGEVVSKSEAHKKGLWHRASHVWVINTKGELLLQKRSRNDYVFPGLWDISAAGHVSAGETPLETARRETWEELGISGDFNFELAFIFKEKLSVEELKHTDNEFDYVYLLEKDVQIGDLVPQEEEVDELRFVSIGQLEVDLQNTPDQFVPHAEEYKKLFSLLRHRFSS